MMKLSRKKMKSLNEFLTQLIEDKLSESGQILKTVKFSEISFNENSGTGQLTISKVIAKVRAEVASDNVPVSESYNLTIYGPALFDYSENNGYVLTGNQSLNFTKQRGRKGSESVITK